MRSQRFLAGCGLSLLYIGLTGLLAVHAQTPAATPGSDAAPAASVTAASTAPAPATASPTAAKASPTPAHPPARPGPTWAELSDAERDGLAPLSGIWPRLSEGQKLKWRAVVASQEFENPENRAKFQERMKTWAQLSASERAQARLNYAMINSVPAEERLRKWETYRELPEEERHRLMQQQMRQVWGAATPMTPAPKDRLAALPPPPSPDAKRMDRFQPSWVDPITLLPK